MLPELRITSPCEWMPHACSEWMPQACTQDLRIANPFAQFRHTDSPALRIIIHAHGFVTFVIPISAKD